jgi:hypothetical protein
VDADTVERALGAVVVELLDELEVVGDEAADEPTVAAGRPP